MQNSILGMASHDVSNTKATILRATPGAILGIDGHPRERFSFAPAFSARFFKNWGGPRVQDNLERQKITSKNKNHLVVFMVVLKDLLGGFFLMNKKTFQGIK